MSYNITKHFDYLTPFEEATDDHELEQIMRLKYPKACSKLETDAGFFADMVAGVQKHKAWRVIGFDSFEDFCHAKLGKTLDEVSSIVSGVRSLQARGISKPTAAEALAEAPKLAKHGEIGQGRNRGSERTSIARGENVSYLAARLRRDHPEICQRIEAGEFKSVRAAAIEAGIIKVKTPAQQLMHWWERASEGERKEFLKWCMQ